jgi:DNA mismatch repair protein MutH
MRLIKIQKDNFLKVMSKYNGVAQSKLISELNIELSNGQPKNIRSLIAQSILKNYEKEEKIVFQNTLLKTIRINETNTILESMSFTQIKYNEIINQSWENSDLYKILSSEFIFFIFKVRNKDDRDPVFHNAIFWKMSEADLDLVNKFWELTKESIRIGDYKNFVTIKNDFICHVRTKGLNNKDLMVTPQGTIEPKRGYWLNASYLKTQLF